MTTSAWLLRVLAACVLVSVLSHEPRAKPLPVPVCAWPGSAGLCCTPAPSLGVAWLRDLRAERIATRLAVAEGTR